MRFLKLHFRKDRFFFPKKHTSNLFKCHKQQLRSGDAEALFPMEGQSMSSVHDNYLL